MTHSFICATWLTHSYVRHDAFIHMCDMTHSYVRHDSFIHTCDITFVTARINLKHWIGFTARPICNFFFLFTCVTHDSIDDSRVTNVIFLSGFVHNHIFDFFSYFLPPFHIWRVTESCVIYEKKKIRWQGKEENTMTRKKNQRYDCGQTHVVIFSSSFSYMTHDSVTRVAFISLICSFLSLSCFWLFVRLPTKIWGKVI